MFKAAGLMVAASQAAELTVFVPEGTVDKGYFAGLKEGLFLPIEEHALRVTECKKPRAPRVFRSEYVKQAMTFWPMIKQMITVKFNGVEPKFLAAIEDIVERMIILVSIAVGKYEESAYCFGAINMFEMKAIMTDLWEALQDYLPEGMLPDISQIPPIKMALDMMGGKMPVLPEMPTVADVHPKLQAAMNALF